MILADASGAAAIITALASVGTAVGGLLVSLALVIPILRKTKEAANQTLASTLVIETETKQTLEHAESIHEIVNQQRTDMIAYQMKLLEQLRQAGIAPDRDPYG